ncbi:hypothetical protein ACFYTQ_35485 [Nocardia sp. NPDC004068]|uniref:hypothetical protein n=1 Tax=Nocardia sp. NPDC004068 TaxID=3364303 RepID=UPI00369E1B24
MEPSVMVLLERVLAEHGSIDAFCAHLRRSDRDDTPTDRLPVLLTTGHPGLIGLHPRPASPHEPDPQPAPSPPPALSARLGPRGG